MNEIQKVDGWAKEKKKEKRKWNKLRYTEMQAVVVCRVLVIRAVRGCISTIFTSNEYKRRLHTITITSIAKMTNSKTNRNDIQAEEEGHQKWK